MLMKLTFVESVKRQMEKDRDEDDRNVPTRLLQFIDTPDYYRFLQALLDYCRELFRLENKQQVLEAEARQRGLPVP